jgi:hypothetical protein
MVMPSDHTRSLASWLLQEIEWGRTQRSIQPFGDGPFEAGIAKALRDRLKAEPADFITEMLNSAIQTSIASILAGAKDIQPYENLISLSLIARYLSITIEDWGIAEALAFIRKQALTDSRANQALAAFIRTLARTNAFSDVDALVELGINGSRNVRAAAIESLARLGTEKFVPILAAYVSSNPRDNNSQLLWTIAHNEAASSALAASTNEENFSVIVNAMRSALTAVDPTGNAYGNWIEKVRTAPPNPSFDLFDWRKAA